MALPLQWRVLYILSLYLRTHPPLRRLLNAFLNWSVSFLRSTPLLQHVALMSDRISQLKWAFNIMQLKMILIHELRRSKDAFPGGMFEVSVWRYIQESSFSGPLHLFDFFPDWNWSLLSELSYVIPADGQRQVYRLPLVMFGWMDSGCHTTVLAIPHSLTRPGWRVDIYCNNAQ